MVLEKRSLSADVSPSNSTPEKIQKTSDDPSDEKVSSPDAETLIDPVSDHEREKGFGISVYLSKTLGFPGLVKQR